MGFKNSIGWLGCKEVEILVLRHELGGLRRQVHTAASFSTSHGSQKPVAKRGPRSVRSPALRPTRKALKVSSETPRCEAFTTRHSCATSACFPHEPRHRGQSQSQEPTTYGTASREERLQDKTITINGREQTLAFYARGGAVGIDELTETGDLTFTELPRVRTHRNRDQSGKYRWYNDYQLPDRYAAHIITVRLHGNPQDADRKFNRTENVRSIPPSNPDFARLYPRRNDAESINRNIEDTLWIGRAHSIGHARQHLNLLGYGLMVNGLALHRHRRHRTHQLAA